MGRCEEDIIREKQARINLDENAVKPYVLPPSPFAVCRTQDEFAAVRSKVLKLFADEMYGAVPPAPEEISWHEVSNVPVYNGLGTRREIEILCSHKGKSKVLHLMLHLPRHKEEKVPCFFGLNFYGNASTTTETGVSFLPFDRSPYGKFVDSDPANAKAGMQAYRFDYEQVLSAGFASATIWYFELFPDHREGFRESIMPLFYSAEQWQSENRPSTALSAWAWGIMRAVDCLAEQPEIDPGRIFVHGHSRLGKAALWAGANDERIALTVSNCSGCGGAKLTHRYFGENLEWLLHFRDYWFVPRFQQYICNEVNMPFDQHWLMGCCMPRALYVASAVDDCNADPAGEFLATRYASECWERAGFEALPAACVMPPADSGITAGNLRYFLRSGKHDITPENWADMLKFAAAL